MKDQARWHVTKIVASVPLAVVVVVVADGIDSSDSSRAWWSCVGFVVSIGVLTGLAISIMKDGEW